MDMDERQQEKSITYFKIIIATKHGISLRSIFLSKSFSLAQYSGLVISILIPCSTEEASLSFTFSMTYGKFKQRPGVAKNRL